MLLFLTKERINKMKVNANGIIYDVLFSPQEILKKVMKDDREESLYFGCCCFEKQEIHILRTLNNDMKVRTFIHELTHVSLEHFSLCLENYNQENVCDLVSNVYNFVNENVKKFNLEINGNQAKEVYLESDGKEQ